MKIKRQLELIRFLDTQPITKRLWLYKCWCGKEVIIKIYLVENVWQKTCWCYTEKVKESFRKSRKYAPKELKNTKLHNIFKWMLYRCDPRNKKDPKFSPWAWKWIEVEWNNFMDFYNDMWSSYKEWLTIDRKNPDRNYCKDNCRRLTKSDNAKHRNWCLLKW